MYIVYVIIISTKLLTYSIRINNFNSACDNELIIEILNEQFTNQ